MAIFVATYDYADGSEETRVAHRGAHRGWLGGQSTLLASGPTDAPGAVLIFEAESAADVEAVLDDDPYTALGVIGARRVVCWEMVLGSWRGPLGLE